MIGKVLALALAGVSPMTPANPATNPVWEFADAEPAKTEAGINPSVHPEIVRVDCLTSRGTAVRVGPRVLVSVAHVTSNFGCTINGEPIKVTETKGDFAIIESAVASDHWLQIDCGGFVKGRTYEAIGFARGVDTQTTIDVVAEGSDFAGFYRLWGIFTVIPGQSGGAFVDRLTHRIVGMINVYDARYGFSGSVPLKETSLCGAHR